MIYKNKLARLDLLIESENNKSRSSVQTNIINKTSRDNIRAKKRIGRSESLNKLDFLQVIDKIETTIQKQRKEVLTMKMENSSLTKVVGGHRETLSMCQRSSLSRTGEGGLRRFQNLVGEVIQSQRPSPLMRKTVSDDRPLSRSNYIPRTKQQPKRRETTGNPQLLTSSRALTRTTNTRYNRASNNSLEIEDSETNNYGKRDSSNENLSDVSSTFTDNLTDQEATNPYMDRAHSSPKTNRRGLSYRLNQISDR